MNFIQTQVPDLDGLCPPPFPDAEPGYTIEFGLYDALWPAVGGNGTMGQCYDINTQPSTIKSVVTTVAGRARDTRRGS